MHVVRPKMSLFERIVGRESALKKEVRRHIPSQGWTNMPYMMSHIATTLRGIVTPDVLREVLVTLPDCEIRGDKVCRSVWLDTADPNAHSLESNHQAREVTSDEELAHIMAPYVPYGLFVPIRAISRMAPFDMTAALRLNRFQFLARFPDRFEVAHCLDDNILVARRKKKEKEYYPLMYDEFELEPEFLCQIALCLPSMRGISDAEAVQRIPIKLRRDLRMKGWSLVAICAMYEELFDVVRMDDENFNVTIRSIVSDEDNTDPDGPRMRHSDLDLLYEERQAELDPLAQPEKAIGGRVPITEENFLETALQIHAGKRKRLYRNKHKHNPMMHADALGRIIEVHLPATGEIEYDELAKRLPQNAVQALQFEEGGLHGFLKARPDNFTMVAKGDMSAPEVWISRGKVQLVPEKPALITEGGERRDLEEDEDESYYDDEDDDPLCVAVASHIPEGEEGGLPLRELGKQLSKETRAEIKALGVNLHGFLESHPEWFIIGEGEDPRITLAPVEEWEEDAGEEDDEEESDPVTATSTEGSEGAGIASGVAQKMSSDDDGEELFLDEAVGKKSSGFKGSAGVDDED